MVKAKKELVIIGLIVLMILALIGVSYAAFNYSATGTKLNSITTGAITMRYEESDNIINIDNALPTKDSAGTTRLKEGEYFDFTISSEISGDININYEISAKDVTVVEGNEKKIDGSNIKLYLTRLTDDGEEELMSPRVYSEESTTNSYTGRPSGEMSLYTSSMSSSERNRYRLRMYVDEGYNPQGDGGNLKFAVKINVYGKDGLSMEDRMMRTAGSMAIFIPTDFHTDEIREKATSIVTKGDTVIPEGVIESWDISEKQNGSVIAYIEDDGTDSGTYKVTIGGEGKIIANTDMSYYFAGFENCTTIDLSYLDTSFTTNMSDMFAVSPITRATMKVKQIIFSDFFNTSQVTNMNEMFYGCTDLEGIDLSSFDTSKVETMTRMFHSCRALTKLDLTNFDTSNVIETLQMFDYCDNLTEIRVKRDKWTIPSSAISNSGVTDFTYI